LRKQTGKKPCKPALSRKKPVTRPVLAVRQFELFFQIGETKRHSFLLFLFLIENKNARKRKDSNKRLSTSSFLCFSSFPLKKMLFDSYFLEIKKNNLYSLCLHRSKTQEK
jgi:hypothetical protein